MENNPILIEHETNELYRVYKDVKAKVESVKTSYVDLCKKNDEAEALFAQHKLKLTEILSEISGQKLAWATEKAREMKKIEDKISELDNALQVKKELNEKQREIDGKIEKNTDILNETRRLELFLKEERTEFDIEKKLVAAEKKNLSVYETSIKDKEEAFKEKLTKLIADYHG